MKLGKITFAVCLIAALAAAVMLLNGVHADASYADLGKITLANVGAGALALRTESAASFLARALDPQGRLNVLQMRPYLDDNGDARIIVNQGNGQYGSIAANAPALLRIDEWRDIDRAVVQAGADRLTGIADLEGMGLVHNLGSIGITVSTYEKVSEMTPAQVSMDGITEGEKDTPAFDHDNIPVPIIHKDFDVNVRRLVASRMFGESIDVTASSIASRLVAEGCEDMLFAGKAIRVGGGTIYGYTTHPKRNTVAMGTAWTSAAPAGIIGNVKSALASLRSDHFYGPYKVYIPGAYEGVLDEDYLVGDEEAGITVTTKTIRDRLLALSGVKEIAVADRLTGDNVVVVQLTRDVVDLAKAQGITTVNWQAYGGMQERFKVMAVQVPRIKATFDGECGVAHIRPE